MEERFAYEQLAGELGEQVRAGVLRPGDRIPSVRRMSRERGVSVSTVLQAYRLLEARRVVAARPQSGFYVLPPPAPRAGEPERTRTAGEPTEVTTADLIADVLGAPSDPSLVPLGAAVPHPDLLPAAGLNRMMGSVLRRVPEVATVFLGPRGAEELRREVARREWGAGCRVSADDVWITCGASEALSLALRAVTRPGDTVAVESPTFFGVLQAIEAMGCRALEIPMDARDGICLDALRRAVAAHPVKACVVTPSFHNPLGSLMPVEARRELVGLAREKEIPLIEDDTFGELYWEGPRPRSLLAEESDDRVIRCGSFSKTLAPGYRLGWMVPGPRFVRAVERLKYSSTVSVAAPPQLALAEYLGGTAFDSHLQRLRRVLRTSVERLSFEVLDRFPEGTRVSRPAGGFLLWVQLPEGCDAVRIHREARRRGVGVSPGSIYSATGQYGNCLRLSAGHPWSDRIAAGLDVLARVVRGVGPVSALRAG